VSKRNRLSRVAREWVERCVESVCYPSGCPKCCGATRCVQSQTVEFPDGSLMLVVVHSCDRCECTHHSSGALGGLAAQALPGVQRQLQASGDFEPLELLQ
jgi:hypothetical protein